MLQVKRGSVKFFRADKGWGFITPQDGSEDVYFHVDYYSGVNEDYCGELELKFDQDSTLVEEWRAPKAGEELIYEDHRGQRGLMAVHWLRPHLLDQAQKMLATRLAPNNPFIRVMRSSSREARWIPTIIWEGNSLELKEKLDEGFPEIFDCRYYVEKLKIDGKWDRVYHPTGWHEKCMTPYGDKLPGTRIRLHTEKVRNAGLDGTIKGINGHFDENGDGMFKNPSYGVMLDGERGVIHSFRRSDFDIVTKK